MAAKWLKKYLTMKPEVSQIFEDLDNYRKFCVNYGHVFDEKNLYNERTSWGEYQRSIKGREPRNMWYAKKERT